MKSILQKLAPQGTIIGIPSHKKGPVYAVSQIFDLIDDDEETIINYCDFSTYWNYQDFLHHTRTRKADGAIPSYKGFHPHMLGTTNYAFIKDHEQWLEAIKEKDPFTSNRMQEYASNGTYYFSKGTYVKKYFQQLMDLDINLNGEYYVSLVYNLMQQDGLKTSVYEIQHMLQWGTPQDVEEYNQWSHYFSSIITQPQQAPATQENKALTLIPMAGKGQRFADVGYTTPKPLIPVSGKPMIVQATESLPRTNRYTFVCLQEHLTKYPAIQETLQNSFPNTKIVTVDTFTQGQACIAELGITEDNLNNPLFVGACDNGMTFNHAKYQELINDTTIEAIALTFRNHPASKQNPHMYGWVKTTDDNTVTGVSVKKPISDNPGNDHAIVGAFYFSTAGLFLKAAHELYKNNIRVNNEFYIDSCIDVLAKLGHTVKVFEVDHYLCWGTPNDYKTFEYWQSFFHKCNWHPYSLEKDPTVEQSAIQELDKKYKTFDQEWTTLQIIETKTRVNSL
jgi:NDP-sugar pyrophosphorylase family protein